MGIAILLISVFWLAWSNGSNDNFKGVATLYGSATCSFKRTLIWGTSATIIGSLVSVLITQSLIAAFSGKGLIPDSLIDQSLLTAVGASGAITIFLATLLGMPTSTTHALTGALIGVALVADPTRINWHLLAVKFAEPLLLSPVAAIVITAIAYVVLRRARLSMGIERQTCLCIGDSTPQPVLMMNSGTALLVGKDQKERVVQIGDTTKCVERYGGKFIGVNAQSVVDTIHYASGAAVCFARAVNDTPKIAALILTATAFRVAWGTGTILLVTAAMAAGGLLQSRKVAETMSNRITDLNCGQGLTANLVTASLVLCASRIGVPVSTTHVSCGSIFGIGIVNENRNWKTIVQVLITWLTTLPLGLTLGAGIYWLITH